MSIVSANFLKILEFIDIIILLKFVNNITTVKDLLYIEDMMNWNFIMNKKIYSFLECASDSEVKEILTKAKKMHAKHYKELLSILE